MNPERGDLLTEHGLHVDAMLVWYKLRDLKERGWCCRWMEVLEFSLRFHRLWWRFKLCPMKPSSTCNSPVEFFWPVSSSLDSCQISMCCSPFWSGYTCCARGSAWHAMWGFGLRALSRAPVPRTRRWGHWNRELGRSLWISNFGGTLFSGNMSVKVYEKAKLIMEVYGSLNWENAEELDLNRCCTTFLDKLKLQDFSVDHGVSICSSPSCSVSNYAIVLKITVLALRISLWGALITALAPYACF